MSDDYNPYDPAAAPGPSGETQTLHHHQFPWVRLAYAFGFAIVAYVMLWAVFILGAAQFITTAISGTPNAELKGISQGATRYLLQLVDYIIFVREELPFPFAPFPRE